MSGTEQSTIHEQLSQPHIERMLCLPNWTHEASILHDPKHKHWSQPALLERAGCKNFFMFLAISIPTSHMGSKWHQKGAHSCLKQMLTGRVGSRLRPPAEALPLTAGLGERFRRGNWFNSQVVYYLATSSHKKNTFFLKKADIETGKMFFSQQVRHCFGLAAFRGIVLTVSCIVHHC